MRAPPWAVSRASSDTCVAGSARAMPRARISDARSDGRRGERPERLGPQPVVRVRQGRLECRQMIRARREFEQAHRRDADLARLGVGREQAPEAVPAGFAGGCHGPLEAGADGRLTLGGPALRDGRHLRRADRRQHGDEQVRLGRGRTRKRSEGLFRRRRRTEPLQRLRGQHAERAVGRVRADGLDRVNRSAPRRPSRPPSAASRTCACRRSRIFRSLPAFVLAADEVAEQRSGRAPSRPRPLMLPTQAARRSGGSSSASASPSDLPCTACNSLPYWSEMNRWSEYASRLRSSSAHCSTTLPAIVTSWAPLTMSRRRSGFGTSDRNISASRTGAVPPSPMAFDRNFETAASGMRSTSARTTSSVPTVASGVPRRSSRPAISPSVRNSPTAAARRKTSSNCSGCVQVSWAAARSSRRTAAMACASSGAVSIARRSAAHGSSRIEPPTPAVSR